MTMTVTGHLATETISRLLWRTWFDQGLIAIEQGDFTAAVTWLHEAIQHVCAGGDDDKRHAMTEAHLAYAHLLQAQKWCLQAMDRCTKEHERKELTELAETSFGRASAYGNSSGPRLRFDEKWPQINLATARSAYVLGEMLFKCGNLTGALERFEFARTYYLHVPAEVGALEGVYYRLYEINYQLGDFKRAKNYLLLLDGRAADRNDGDWLARLIAARADVLLQLGNYRAAVELYERWKRFAPDCDAATESGYACAFALVTFGRAHLILGYYDTAQRLLEQGRALFECPTECGESQVSWLPPNNGSIRFDAALSLAELALNRGEFTEARVLLAVAANLCPVWPDRKIRLCLVTGRLHLALGCFKEACLCFTEARNLAERTTPCRLLLLVPALLGLSRVESETSNWMASINLASMAVHWLEHSPHLVSAEMAQSLHGLAISYVRDDRSQEALPLCEKGRSMMTLTLRAGHPDEAALQLTLAEHYISRRQPRHAIEACERALELFCRYAPQDAFAIARTLRITGEAYQVDRHCRCAFNYFERALNLWQCEEARLQCQHPEKALIMLDVSVCNISQGAYAAAGEWWKLLKKPLCELKGNAARAGYELNRRGNLCLLVRMYYEAEWLYCLAEEYYCECYGANHDFTRQVRANAEKAKKLKNEPCQTPQNDCC